MELLRIIAMFLVLMEHANYWSLGAPTPLETHTAVLPSFTRFFFEGMSRCCVDVFILISGWYGIRASVRGLAKFVFQCLFFGIGIYAVCLLTGFAPFGLRGIAGCFSLLHWDWFVKSYVLLYLLAPVLNSFVQQASQRQFGGLLAAFYLFQTLYGWSNAAGYFEQGFSAISFAGLYLLSRYLRLYVRTDRFGAPVYFGGYLLLVLATACTAFAIKSAGYVRLSNGIYSYISPFVIGSALCLLLAFARLRLQSRAVNRIAASSFSVLLLHMNPNLNIPLYKKWVRAIYAANSGPVCLLKLGLLMLGVFAAAVLIDRIRIACWRRIERAADRSQRFGGLHRFWTEKSPL